MGPLGPSRPEAARLSLSRATLPDGTAIALPGAAPYPCDMLWPLVNQAFDLPCDDPWLARSGSPAHTYLDAARDSWQAWPDWMDSEDPHSPAFSVKRASRDLYLHHWKPWLRGGRVLDLGCGIGRLTLPLLDRGATVWGVDGDLQSLRHLAWRAAGRSGWLDLHWSSVKVLPEVSDLDAVIASEVLCYVPHVEDVLADVVERLRPGGALLVSMEARWGWAVAQDAAPAPLAQLLGEGAVIHLPDDRWVRTYDEASLRALLESAGLRVERVVPTHYAPEGPLERSAPPDLDLKGLLEVEDACRAHPVWGPLNRVWTAAAVKA